MAMFNLTPRTTKRTARRPTCLLGVYINKWLLSGLVGHLHHEINPKLASANSPSIAKPRRMLNTRDFGLMDFDGMLAVDSRRLEPCERSDRNNVMGDVYYQTCWWHNPNAVHLSKAINRVWISEFLIKKKRNFCTWNKNYAITQIVFPVHVLKIYLNSKEKILYLFK